MRHCYVSADLHIDFEFLFDSQPLQLWPGKIDVDVLYSV